MKFKIFVALLFLISTAAAYTQSPISIPGYNQYGYDTNLRGWGIWNGTLNGTNFQTCLANQSLYWNGSNLLCREGINTTYTGQILSLQENDSLLQANISALKTNDTKYQNHANLTNLSYTTSGHTGFVSTTYLYSDEYYTLLNLGFVNNSMYGTHSHDQGCSYFYTGSPPDGLCIYSSKLYNDAGFINGSQFQANISYDIVARFPLNISGGGTRTLTIQPNFTNVRADTIKPNSTDTDYGIDLRNAILKIYHGALSYINISTSKINITSPEINLNGSSKINITSPEINLFGVMNINGKNIENELVKTSVKSFQADYLNASQIYTDIIIIPQDVKLTNITSLIEKSTNSTNFTLNFSIEKYSSYPTDKIIILNYSMSSNVNNFDSIDYNFSDRDVILLNYTTYTNVSKSLSLFKFVVR